MDEQSAPLRAPAGTHDVLWPQSARWERLVAEFARRAQRAGFGLVISPMFEDAALFRRGIGDESDVVRKEMYEFADRGGRDVALRPEGTASVVRAFVQHHPPVPWKAWYVTPAFRYERPQAGRYKQHHQLGVEVLGTEDPDVDVEVITLAADLYAWLGLRQVELSLNSMGCGDVPGRVCRRARGLSGGARRPSCATSTASGSGPTPCEFSTASVPSAGPSPRGRRASPIISTRSAPPT